MAAGLAVLAYAPAQAAGDGDLRLRGGASDSHPEGRLEIHLSVQANSPASDRAALEALYDASGGDDWENNDNWLTTAPLGGWYGVATNDSGLVTSLNLPQNHLSGTIPDALGDLADLETLVLSENALTGAIPAALGDLAKLRTLDLFGNQLSGGIPAEIGNLASLESLRLEHNGLLSGALPAELGNLANLRNLQLADNRFSGPVPAEFGDLASLEAIYLSSNRLSGSLPQELGDLANLRILLLTDNRLTGPIPPELGDLANLGWLSLARNQLSGAVPAELGDLAKPLRLDLAGNRLSGSIPSELGDMDNLLSIHLSNNRFTGCVPAGLRDVPDSDLDDLGLPFCGATAPQVAASFGQAAYTVAEGGSIPVEVRLGADPERTVEIPLTADGRGGASGDDYSGIPDSLTFHSGDTAQSFTFTATDDTADDDDESVRLGFGNLPAGVVPGSPEAATVGIADDDFPAVAASFGQSAYTVAEGGSIPVEVRLGADPERTVEIPLTADGRGGASGHDYSGIPDSVTFHSGDTAQSFTFTATDDTVDDDDESVRLGFGGLPTGVVPGSPEAATVSIADDDFPEVAVSFGQAAYTVVEGGSISVEVRLGADPERTVEIPLTIDERDGASGEDYTGVPDTVVIASGTTEASFAFNASPDDQDDDGESVRLGFGILPAGVAPGSIREATVDITDDGSGTDDADGDRQAVNSMEVNDTSLWEDTDGGRFVFHDNRSDTANDPVPDAWNIYGQPLEFDAVSVYADGGIQVDIDTEDDTNAHVSSGMDPTVGYVVRLSSGEHSVTVAHEGDIGDVKIVPDNADTVSEFHDLLDPGTEGTAVVSDGPQDGEPQVVNSMTVEDTSLWEDTGNGLFVFHNNRAGTTNEPVPDAWNVYGQPLEFDAVLVHADGRIRIDIDIGDDPGATVSSALDPTVTYAIELSSDGHSVTVVHEGDIGDVTILPENADAVSEFHDLLTSGTEGTAAVSDDPA